MDWPHDVPIGMIRYDELLNALLAIWKTQYNFTRRESVSEISQDYQAGFEEGLDAAAQMFGLSEAFEAAKASHRTRVQSKMGKRVEIMGGRALLVDSGEFP